MILGVIGFSFASGSLASILQNVDTQSTNLEEKLFTLNKIHREYYLPLKLYIELKQSLKYSQKKDIDDLNHFIQELPPNLNVELSLYIHEQTYKTIKFFNNRSDFFKTWLCPMLKPMMVLSMQSVY